jgi:hypothetical protein
LENQKPYEHKMTEQPHGTVAVLELKPFVTHSFDDIVEEFDLAFRPPGLTRRALIRDGDDIAIIERGPVRIVLGWLAHPTRNKAPHLVLAIGRTEDLSAVILDDELFRLIKAHLLMHAESYLPVASILHRQADRPVGAELVDAIAGLLNHTGYPHAQTYATTEDAADEGHYRPTSESYPHKADPAYKVHAKHEDIYEGEFHPSEDDSKNALPQALTVYTVGATILMVSPPVGTFVLVYASLRAFVGGPADSQMHLGQA